ncbi:MAG TPA: exopolysaccharide biosynthesis protein [Alphaproteobacteria bacterium]
MPAIKLMEALTQVEEQATGDTICLGDIIDTFNGRGFGALLILPSLFVVLPTGALPFVPFICGVFMILICAQVVVGRRNPWMPNVLRRIGFARSSYDKVMHKAEPYISFVDRMSSPRLKFLALPMSQRFIALLCIILSAVTAAVALLPLASHFFALAITFFAIGMTSRDGWMTMIGFIITILAFAVMPALIASSQDLMGPHLIAPLPVEL